MRTLSEQPDRGGILKYCESECYDSIPNLFVLHTYYINTSSVPVCVTGWENSSSRFTSSETYAFQPTSTAERQDWMLPVEEGFYQRNFLGMNNTDYGGGIPLIYLWDRDGGVATGLCEPVLREVSMPICRPAGSDAASFSLRYDCPQRILLSPGDTLKTYSTFVSAHRGDYFDAVRSFTRMMGAEYGFTPESSPSEAFEPVWCAWGYERTFTPDEIIATLPKVRELGFKWVDVDDGYQISEGDWHTRKGFPGGDRAMRRIADAIHSQGLKAKIWYAPLAADPGSEVLKKYPQALLQTRDGAPEYITYWDSYYLSPVNPYTRKLTDETVKMFLDDWDFDGLKLDGQHLNCCMPDFNPDSDIDSPEEAAERMPEFFGEIMRCAGELKPGAVVQLCPCGCAINFFHLPHFNQAVASDPVSSRQVRMKCKTYKAISNSLAYYADHVELTDGGMDFATQLGIGGVPGSKFTYPAPNPNVEGDGYLLTPEKEAALKKWIGLYNGLMLSKGTYLNLYDIAFDSPETHLISKGDRLYYAFYADRWDARPIELRGLTAKKYVARAYADDNRTFEVDSSDPWIRPVFEGCLLLELTPAETD